MGKNYKTKRREKRKKIGNTRKVFEEGQRELKGKSSKLISERGKRKLGINIRKKVEISIKEGRKEGKQDNRKQGKKIRKKTKQ